MHVRQVKHVKRFPGIVLSIALFSLIVYLLGWSTLLSAQHVEIEGSLRVGEIKNAIFTGAKPLDLGVPLARVDVHTINRKVAELDWVESGQVKRDWLHGTIRIRVIERVPIAQFIDEAGSIKFVDSKGAVFAGKAGSQIPTVLLAIGKGNRNQGAMIDSLASFIQQLPRDLIGNLENLSLRSPDFIQSRHTGLGSGHLYIRWGSTNDMAVKVKVLRSLLSLPENADARLVDLTAPLSPIAK